MDPEETTSITKPQAYGGPMCLGLNSYWDKQSQTLAVWPYAGHQADGRHPKMTSVALSLARGLSHSD